MSFNSNSVIYLLVYVHDILITGNDQQSTTTILIQSLNKAFALENLRYINYFLGIQVSSLPNGGFHLYQRKYIISKA